MCIYLGCTDPIGVGLKPLKLLVLENDFTFLSSLYVSSLPFHAPLLTSIPFSLVNDFEQNNLYSEDLC